MMVFMFATDPAVSIEVASGNFASLNGADQNDPADDVPVVTSESFRIFI